MSYWRLTSRQRAVARMLVSGTAQNCDIAKELGLSVNWVKTCNKHIFDETGRSSRLELMIFARTNLNFLAYIMEVSQ